MVVHFTNSIALLSWFPGDNDFPVLQSGSEEPSVPALPGGGDLSLPSHLRHVADGEPDGAVEDRVPRGAAVDEGRVPGAGPRHEQTDGEVPQGLSPTF